MLRFERLKITNFGPFKGEQSIEFTQNNGVTIVWGYNGRGKTSLLNVFRYALFGYVKYRRGTREYIQAMIDSGNEDITPEWIEWALKKADWYDPSIETEDEYLGKRQHEKSAEEKEKSLQDSIRKSWYW